MRNLSLIERRTVFRRQVYIGLWVFALLVLGVGVFIAYQSRQSVEQEASIRVQNLAISIDDTLAAEVSKIEVTLSLMVNAIELSLSKGELSERELTDAIAAAQGRESSANLRVLDANGQLINDEGLTTPLDQRNWQDREYFKGHQTNSSKKVVVGKPILGRLLNELLVTFSMRYNLPDGRFGGVVVMPITVTRFNKILTDFDHQSEGIAAIRYRADMSLLTRNRLDPNDPQSAIGNLNISPQLRDVHMSGVATAVFYSPKALDGKTRITAYKRGSVSPFFVLVSSSSSDYLRGWYQALGLLAGMFLLVVLAGWLVAEALIKTTVNTFDKEARLQSLFDLSAAGIVRTNMKGAFIEFNHAFVNLCGYTPDELNRLDYWKLTPERFKQDELLQIEAIEKTGRYGPYRKQYMHKDGTLIDVELSGVVVKDHEDQPFIWSIVTDITQELKAQSQLRQAKETADSANLAKSQFLATMSHELRTPLNGVLGMAQLLARPEVTPNTRIDLARTIISSGKALASLLADLMDVSQIDTNKLVLRPEPCDVQALVHDVVAVFNPAILDKALDAQVRWHGPERQLYRLDPIRLRQMLTNLVSNAIKFTEHGFVHIDARELERHGNAAVLEFAVADSGLGISKEQQELLFKRFSQVENGTVPVSAGTGLGLSIVQGLAKRMGGSAGVESESGQGSRFWFRIQVVVLDQEAAEPLDPQRDLLRANEPAEPLAPALPEPMPVPANAGDGGVCLVVEDNLINQKVIVNFLSDLDIAAQCVGNGQEAVHAIERGLRPKFILMDVQMPVMDGLVATQIIREWEKANLQARTVIIGLTAGAVAGDRDRCIDSGMDDVLFKPIDLDALETKIFQALNTQTILSLDQALSSHIHYKLNIRQSIDRNETMDVQTVSRDDCCVLGKWIHGPGGRLFGHIAEFSDLKRNHVTFHQQVGLVAKVVNQKDFEAARLMLDAGTPYASATAKVCAAIMALQKKAVQ